MNMHATDKHGQEWDILLPTPDRLLESLQRRDRLEAAAKNALPFLRDLASSFQGGEEEMMQASLSSTIRELEEALQIEPSDELTL